MESNRPSVFAKNNDEGRDRVSKGKRLYAFIMESTSIEYIVERHCDLVQVGGQLDSKGYGIAMPMSKNRMTIHIKLCKNMLRMKWIGNVLRIPVEQLLTVLNLGRMTFSGPPQI